MSTTNLDREAAARSAQVKAWASAHGFDACGVAAAGPADPENNLGQWLAQGFQADMQWMARTQEERQDIFRRLPGARSVVVVAKNYYSGQPPEGGARTGRVARYAWGRDYHRALKKPLRRLAEQIAGLAPAARYSLSIDSSPVLERTWAARGGLGWIGKNSLVLRRDIGSYFFLATILTTVELAPDAPMEDHCGSCRACLDACPTQAIVDPGVVDSRKCISYHTIENRGEIPDELAQKFEGWVFGCDICQEVCPWNRFAEPTDDTDFRARPGQAAPSLDALLDMSEATFSTTFEGTPIRRTRRQGMQRNARIALGDHSGRGK
jgi:epoxyqueuosine reductase